MIHTMKSADVIRRLRSEGWELHHVKGSHYQFKHPERPGKITVPHPQAGSPGGDAPQHLPAGRLEMGGLRCGIRW